MSSSRRSVLFARCVKQHSDKAEGTFCPAVFLRSMCISRWRWQLERCWLRPAHLRVTVCVCTRLKYTVVLWDHLHFPLLSVSVTKGERVLHNCTYIFYHFRSKQPICSSVLRFVSVRVCLLIDLLLPLLIRWCFMGLRREQRTSGRELMFAVMRVCSQFALQP